MTGIKIVIPACHPPSSSPHASGRGSPKKAIGAEPDCLGDPGSEAGMTGIKIVIPACFWAGISTKDYLG